MQRIAEGLLDRLLEIGSTTFHTLQELRLVQLFRRRLPDLLQPLVRHDHCLSTQTSQDALVQLGDVCEAVIEELRHQPQQMFLFIEDIVEVKEFKQ